MRPQRTVPSIVLTALALAAGACSSSKGGGGPPAQVLNVPSPAWQDQVIYMVMTDRFADGDPSNDDQHMGEFDPTNKDKYSGGDLQGIIDHLDYIQGLGATAVWITPPVANMWWDPLQQSGGFHGYWARNLLKVDEHLGTLDTYKALSAALHARGMYLIQDVVPNHMGNFFTWSTYPAACAPATTAGTCAVGTAIPGCDVTSGFVRNTAAVPTSKPEQAPFDQDDAADPVQRAAGIYHWTPAITDYTNACQEWNYQISDLDDLNTENPVVRSALRSSYGYWIKTVGVDAFRVDTAKFVPHAFWNDFFWSTDAAAPGIEAVARATGRDDFLAFGEVFETPPPFDAAADSKVASYLGTPAAPELPSVLAFPLYAEIGRVFAGGQPTADMTYRLARMTDPALYPNPFVLPTFIDNHDVRRFLSISSPTGEDLLQALAFLFTVPGIPVVYYGTEQGFTETRAAMFKGGWSSGGTDHFNTASALYQRIRKLADLRKGNPALTRGAIDVVADTVAAPGPFVYRRTLGSETELVIMNTSKSAALLAAVDSKLPPGSALQVLHDEQAPPAPVVGPGGRMTEVLPPKAVIVARATGVVTPPPPPGATIALSTPIDGQVYTTDTTFRGTVTPASTALEMVLDADVGKAASVPVAADGSWSVVLPVSTFATGTFQHDVSFYAPAAGVATPQARFTTDVVFNGVTYDFADPVGDDKGPAGTYTYPQDASFGHQMDVTHVKLEVGATTLRVNVTMADFSTVWNPPNGFDHVAFNLYFSLPGQTGAATVMPKLNGSVPAGFAWSLNQFTFGWTNVMYTSAGADANTYGGVAAAPLVTADAPSKTVTFTYDRNAYGLASWSGVKIYLATWDYDGIGNAFRPLLPVAGQWAMGGGGPVDPLTGQSPDPKIMDDVPPMTIP